jgi:glycosyltransferase involved in cell wall biosynthesis
MVGSTDPDIVNVHNIHGVFSSLWTPELVKHCSDRFPTIWTLHDMWSFTGRCAYNRDCREFETGCDATCPTADEYPQLDPDEIEDAWNLRSNLARSGPNLRAVAPSRWLADEAVTGLWPEASVDVIPYGVPLDVFKPEDRHAARAALGIESSTPVFLAVAVDWIDQRKGGGVLQDALTNWGGGLTLLTMGTDDHDWGGLGDIRVLKLGFIGDEKTLARAFNAADALIHPALQDNLPNVVLEAIACGTPVVSFRTGGLPDMVRPGSTGWLAEKPDAASLAAAIECAVTELEAGSGLRESCRSTAETEFDPRLQAQRYEALFHQVLASGRT